MNFEDTGLPDSPMMRRAFRLTEMDVAGRSIMTPDGKRTPDTMDIQLRTVEILKQHVPGASDEQIAGALLFLTHSFARSGALLMRRAGDDKLMPNVCAWSEEFQDAQKARTLLWGTSEELRQIMAAASVAMMEENKKNFPNLDKMGRLQLDEVLRDADRMTAHMRDYGAPDLKNTHDNLRSELQSLLEEAWKKDFPNMYKTKAPGTP